MNILGRTIVWESYRKSRHIFRESLESEMSVLLDERSARRLFGFTPRDAPRRSFVFRKYAFNYTRIRPRVVTVGWLLVCIIRRKSSGLLTPYQRRWTPLRKPEDGLKCAFRAICIPPLKYTTNVSNPLRVFIRPSCIRHAFAVKFDLSFPIFARQFRTAGKTTGIKIISLRDF